MGKSLKGKELGAGINQRPDGRYCGRFTDRFQKRHTFYGKTVNEVREKLRNAQYEDEHGLNGTCQGVLLDEWYDIFIKDYKVNIRPSTLKGYCCDYNRVRPILGKMPISQIKQLHIQRLMADMQEQGYKSGTIKTCKAFLHNLFETAVSAEIISRNPVDGIVVKNDEETKMRVLTVEEQEIFLNHIENSWYKELFNILLLTGMRIGEAMALTWEDIDFEKRKLYVNKSITQVATGANGRGNYQYILSAPKTKNGNRAIPLVDEAVKIFQSQYDKHVEPTQPSCFGNLVFTGRNGEMVSESNIRNVLRSACKAIRNKGIDIVSISPHMLRHTFATRCYESGMDWYSISRILGHADVETTMGVYVHCLPDKIDEEIKKLKIVGSDSTHSVKEDISPKELVVCKDINHEFCVAVEKCADLSIPYVKIYNRTDFTKATQVAYLRIDKAEYMETPIDDKREWILSEIEQNRLMELMKSRSQRKQWGTNWETILLEFNEINGLQPENTLHNFMSNPIFGEYLCYDMPMPDYTSLQAGKGKIWNGKVMTA